MKTDQVNLRLEASLIAALEEAAREEALDRGTMMRKLLLEGLGLWRTERAVRRYQRGEISIGRASEESGLTHWDMLQLVRARGIAYPLTPEGAEARMGALIGKAPRVADRSRPESAGRRESAPDDTTLPDRPSKRGGVLLVGINPAPLSVSAGHYYQGRIGKRLWRRLAKLGLLPQAIAGREDEAFVDAGNGLTDVVKRPTRSAAELKPEELKLGVEALRSKVRVWSPRLILFVFKQAAAAALDDRNVAAGPCAEFEGVPTFLLSGPYAARGETDRVDQQLLEALRGAGGSSGGAMTQPVTAADIAAGRVRIPSDAKSLFPAGRTEVDIVLRGQRMGSTYDPRNGPDRLRSGVLRVARKTLELLVRPGERLRVRRTGDGVVHLE